jgi:hypothetical protein
MGILPTALHITFRAKAGSLPPAGLIARAASGDGRVQPDSDSKPL